MNRYFVIHKPFQVLSQFSTKENKSTLKDFFTVPTDVYPVGRLDYDSEGLLVLTDDHTLNHLLLHPSLSHKREYFVQVDGEIDDPAIDLLESGLDITVDGKIYWTKPCQAKIIHPPPDLSERIPPVRYRKNIPTSWISLVLTEGKNRQVRKMTAKTGFPTLRLIRYRIDELSLDGLKPGEMLEMDKQSIYSKLSLE